MTISPIVQNILRVLRIQGRGGGLEISNSALRFVWNESGIWRAVGIALPQGTFVDGKVADTQKFLAALTDLHLKILDGRSSETPLHAIVVLASVEAYVQVFNLPLLGESQLDEAVKLNLSMISPVGIERMYAGYEEVGRDERSGKIELLSAFLEKDIIDSISAPMKSAGFVVGAVEPRCMALARVLRNLGEGFSPELPSLIISIEETGISILIVRNARLYFQYFVNWREILGDNRELPWDSFKGAFEEHFRKVITYFGSHWTGAPKEVFLSCGNLSQGISELITAKFGIPVHSFALHKEAEGLSEEWLGALGGGLRALVPLSEDKELSILGLSAREEYNEQQAHTFMSFWKVAFPVWLGALLLFTVGANWYIGKVANNIEAQASSMQTSPEGQQVSALQQKAKEFNYLVSEAEYVINQLLLTPVIDKIHAFLDEQGITVRNMNIDTARRVTLDGKIASQDKLFSVANAFRANPNFSDVDLPLQSIVVSDGGVSFSISFVLISVNTP
ncbi:MAG: hypothetical protein V1489_00600 [Candidatus Liptonbacteria bacterium]